MKVLPNVEFDIEEITMLPKSKVTLTGDDLEYFKRMHQMLDEIDDVQNIIIM
jgi:transcriptional/translational regulatory protein YebC/TACO1